MRNDKPNVIVDKTIAFSLAIIDYCEELANEKKFVIAKQLLRSSTSIGANVFEAQNAESKADFIHKMKIAAKEASETLYWLTLCERSKHYRFDKILIEDLDEVIKILSKIISSAKGRIPGFVWTFLYAFSNFQIFKLTH
ncbi:MAG: four helix bundle protein [Chitinophagaceae bacterium]|nr:four helix bundle protein [Chitinophagaceae bacterium]MCW5927229.1 four helix bundle protein [Chitinophagaceae bacterium]